MMTLGASLSLLSCVQRRVLYRSVVVVAVSDSLYRELAARYGSIGNSGYTVEEILATDPSLPTYVRIAPADDPGY
jgi:hypothetical protein